jgi:hypothetical protein
MKASLCKTILYLRVVVINQSTSVNVVPPIAIFWISNGQSIAIDIISLLLNVWPLPTVLQRAHEPVDKWNIGTVVVVIVWQLYLQLHVQSVPITTKAMSSKSVHGEVYSMQHYVIKFVILFCIFSLTFNRKPERRSGPRGKLYLSVWFMVLSATFNNISVIS